MQDELGNILVFAGWCIVEQADPSASQPRMEPSDFHVFLGEGGGLRSSGGTSVIPSPPPQPVSGIAAGADLSLSEDTFRDRMIPGELVTSGGNLVISAETTWAPGEGASVVSSALDAPGTWINSDVDTTEEECVEAGAKAPVANLRPERPRPGPGAETGRLTRRRLAEGAETRQPGAGLGCGGGVTIEQDGSDEAPDGEESERACFICSDSATFVCKGLPGDNSCRLNAAFCSRCRSHRPFNGCGILCCAPQPATGKKSTSCHRCQEKDRQLVECEDCRNLHCFRLCAAEWDMMNRGEVT